MPAIPPRDQAIPYIPSETKDSDFKSSTQTNDDTEYGIPEGFPDQFRHERAWIGDILERQSHTWTLRLTEDDRKDVAEGLKHFKATGKHPSEISVDTFPLSEELSKRLGEISEKVHNGVGFTVVKGINPGDFTDEENTLVIGGISAHVAPIRGFQDTKQQAVVCHVVSEDLKPPSERVHKRPAFTNGICAFHTDVGDILALYAKGISETGGETYLASSSQTYNELAESNDGRRLLHELVQKWAFYHSQDFQLYGAPLLHTRSGNLVFNFSRIPVTGTDKEGPNRTLPPPTAGRLEAMQRINQIMTRNRLTIQWERGDILYLNNLGLMHARNAFDLNDENKPLETERHLIKLVLRDPSRMWEVPEWAKSLDDHVYGPNMPDGVRSEFWELKRGVIPPDAWGRKFFGGGTDEDGDDCSPANG